MTLPSRLLRALSFLPGRLVDAAFERGLRMPFVRQHVDRELDTLLTNASSSPFGGERSDRGQRLERFTHLPERGRDRDQLLSEFRAIAEEEQVRWADQSVSGAAYHGDAPHVEFLNRVYALTSQANPLQPSLWPTSARCEAEVVAMIANLLGGDAGDRHRVRGTLTSGSTESTLLAMKAYRDGARARWGISSAEVVAPSSAHAVFDEAAHLLGIRLVRIPVGRDFRADVDAMRRAITRRTVALVGSAPCFPHGTIDPIPALSALAESRRIGLHVDAGLGGFILPWAQRLGYPVPRFDFRLSGVTSMSVDPDKYGYAPSGASVVLYRGRELVHHQYFVSTDWPGGVYFSPALAGSRPGGLDAACWAALVSTGDTGYLEATRRILETARTIRRGIEAIPGLEVMGDPLWVISFGSGAFDIYRVLDALKERGFHLNGVQKPPGIQLCVTLQHTQPGVAERFLKALEASVLEVRRTPGQRGTLAPLYGMAASFPARGAVGELLRRYIDRLYEP